MATLSVCQPQLGGFSFENCKRNAVLEAEVTKLGCNIPAARKTGTTICGVVFKDGLVLGADTRATEGMIVADKNCSKIHYISPNIYCCGAGTAADTEMTTQIISSNLELHSLSTSRLPRGHIGAALVLGGVDCNGPHLYSIYPHGSTDKLPYVYEDSLPLPFTKHLEPRPYPHNGRILPSSAVGGNFSPKLI
ncbi:unnamed protein product [Coregonus sp. 'balchen']|nr:unnamed protein product [Coregonus sp. 'balchen']